MVDPLIVLCPIRSFSSVACNILGQHPQTYGLPEVNLFVADDVAGLSAYHQRLSRPRWSGLLRVLAELHSQRQAEDTVLAARTWIRHRQRWSTQAVFDHIIEQVDEQMGDRICVEKSPATVMDSAHLERAYTMYPRASFLHLTRHPVTTGRSIRELVLKTKKEKTVDPFRLWLVAHLNIFNFTEQLPLGQCMRIKGEDLLSEPDVYLPQIAEWLGLDTSTAAIEAMKHPENSPYACVGPVGARFGHDYKFLESPKLRQGKVREPRLADEASLTLDEDLYPAIVNLSQRMGYQ